MFEQLREPERVGIFLPREPSWSPKCPNHRRVRWEMGPSKSRWDHVPVPGLWDEGCLSVYLYKCVASLNVTSLDDNFAKFLLYSIVLHVFLISFPLLLSQIMPGFP